MTWETGQPPPDMSQLMQSGFLAGGNQPLFDDATLTRLQELAAKFGSATKEDERYARGIGLLTAAAGTLASRGGNPLIALGQGGLMGISAQQQVLQDAAKRKDAGLQNMGDVLKIGGMLQGQQRAAALQQRLAAIGQPGNAAPNMTGGQPAQNAQAARSAALSQADIYEQTAEVYRQAGDPENAKRMIDAANAIREKFSQTPQTRLLPTGQTAAYLVGERGTVKDLPEGYAPPVALTFQDTGGSISPRNPYTAQPGAAPIPKSVTPGEAANISLARQRLAMEQGNQGLGRANEIRKEFNALPQVKTYNEVMPVLQSVREAAKTDTAAADLNIIYAAAKIFDPGSVVRESETNMVVAAGSPAERFLGQWNYVAGGGRLTPAARQQLLAQIESRGKGYEVGYKQARKQYEVITKTQGVDPSQVFIEPQVTTAAAGPPVGTVVSGHRFKGGDPNDKANWEPVK